MIKQAILFLVVLGFVSSVLAANDDLSARLNAPQARVRFDQAELLDALAITGESAHVNVVADWGPLLGVGVKQEMPVTMQFENVSAAATFDVICRLVGNGAVWVVQDGVVRFTTQDQVNKQSVTRAYWPNGFGGRPDERTAKAADILRNYVPGMADGAIRINNGQLVISAPVSMQVQIERVLQLCSRPMMPSEWHDLLGIEGELNNSRQKMHIDWRGVPIGSCLNQLSLLAKIPMVLDSQTDTSEAITLQMTDATPRQMMDGILGAAGSSNGNGKVTLWTCEPVADGQVLWIGPVDRARNWCASFLVGPAAMRTLRINAMPEASAAIAAAVPGCDGDHIRWISGTRILCSEKMDQILAIGRVLEDPSFETAMRQPAIGK